MLYLVCASLMTVVRVVEGVLRSSLGATRLEEAPRLWTYFMARLQEIQRQVTVEGPARPTNSVEPIPVGNEPARCRICLQNSPNIVFTPCGHMTCPLCSNHLIHCPFCRADIVRKYRAFF